MKLFQRDITTVSLLLSNLIAIFLAVNQNWNLLTLIWIYWFQSLTIGFFHFLKMLGVKDFSVEKIHLGPGKQTKSNSMKSNPLDLGRLFFAFFFALHYGMFHLFFGFFLLFATAFNSPLGGGAITSFLGVGPAEYSSLALVPFVAGIFFINHLVSFLFYRKKPAEKPNLAAMMFFPYFRIVPTHFIIVFGANFIGSAGNQTLLVLFLLLKTAVDVVMHWVEHRNQWY